jgi:4-amino-4-deoxy-L-arabinose transferase-like glycosyltransferase
MTARRTAFTAFAALWALLVLVAAARLPPIQDEVYYWTWGRAPGWSFVDHPPGISFVLAASSAIFGDGLLGLRAPSILSMATIGVLAAAAARRLAPAEAKDRAVVLSLAILAGAPMFAVGYIPGTPDPLQGATIAIAAYAIVRALEPNAGAIWGLAAGFVLVASVIVKHSTAVLAIGSLIALALVPEGRRALARPLPWIGALAGGLLLAPWLASDLSNGVGSIAYQEARVLHRGLSRGLAAIPVFVGGVLIALGPAGGALVFGQGAREVRRRTDPAETALAMGALLLLAACFIPVVRGGGELNWSMPSLVFIVPVIAARAASAGGRIERFARIGSMASAAVLAVILLHIAAPFLPITAQKDTTRRGAGFDDVARRAGALALEKGARIIVTRRYQLASMIRFHTKDAFEVLELGSDRRSQYDQWRRPELRPGEVAIVVLLSPELPAELDVEPIDPPIEVVRSSGAEPLESYFVTAVRKRGATKGSSREEGRTLGGAPT